MKKKKDLQKEKKTTETRVNFINQNQPLKPINR